LFASQKLFGSEAARTLLEANQLADLDSAFAVGSSAMERHVGRGVVEATLTDADDETAQVFIKLNWGRRRLWPRMTDIKTGQVLQSLPEREWRGLQAFESIGLSVPERLALFQQGTLNIRAAVIVRAVPPVGSLDEWMQDGRWQQLSLEERTELLEGVVAIARRIHSSGFGWRGIGSRHFFPEKLENGRWKFWLIDCEGVHRGATTTVVERDYRKLLRAVRESGAEEESLRRLQRLIEDSTRLRRSA
jgi:hypothetical protein